jgi:hypothetical protein
MQASGSKPSPVPQIVGGIGAVLLIVGSFLTWVTVSLNIDKFAQLLGIDPSLISGSGVDTTTTVSGTSGDGKITLVLGLLALVGVILVVVVANARKAGAVLLLLGGAAGALLCVYEVTTKNKQIDDALNQSGDILSQLGVTADAFKQVFSVSWGIGLWTCLVGGILAAIGGIMALVSKSAAPEMAGAPVAPMGSGFDAPPAATPAAPPAAPTTPEPAAPTTPAPTTPAPAAPMPPAEPTMPAPTEATPSSDAMPDVPETPGDDQGGTTA